MNNSSPMQITNHPGRLLLFSLVHWEDGLANLASTYIFGVFMAIAYLGLRNLWPLVIGHIFIDLVWFG
ncbi:MAG: CPBP family intramembrane metalloprotease [Gammaproteobacteria bacterium]|nr:CPBP family intramembrane metalloprotease [Gammaproteobacteria bacterium]